MAVALHDPVQRERRQRRIGVLDQLERRGRMADLGDGGADRRRQAGPARDGALRVGIAGGDNVDEVGIDQQRRMFEDRQSDRGLVDRQRLHDGRRRIGAACEHLCHGLANERRAVVQQHQQRALGGGAVVLRQIGDQPGPGQSPRGLRALPCGSCPYPTDKVPNDH